MNNNITAPATQINVLLRADPSERAPVPRLPWRFSMPRGAVHPRGIPHVLASEIGSVPKISAGKAKWVQELARLNAFAESGSIELRKGAVTQPVQQTRPVPDSFLLRARAAKEAIGNNWSRFYA